jgi:hypothetical protein
MLPTHQQVRFDLSLKPIIKEVLNGKSIKESHIKKLLSIEKCLNMIEGMKIYDSNKKYKMCLVPFFS